MRFLSKCWNNIFFIRTCLWLYEEHHKMCTQEETVVSMTPAYTQPKLCLGIRNFTNNESWAAQLVGVIFMEKENCGWVD